MMQKKVKLLAIQMGSVIADKESNISKVEKLLTENLSKYNADFVFLPEVWTSGWDCKSFVDCSEDIFTGTSVTMLKNIAKKFNTNIVGGSIIVKKHNGDYVNSSPIINREGNLIGTYEKNHLFSYYGCDEGMYVKAGSHPVMFELDGVKIGLSICYDIRFPELYRAYRKSGADILVNMAAWGANKKIPWDSMTTSRAVENQSFFVALTQTGVLADGSRNLGHSMIIDYKGDVLSEINEKEGAIYAEVDLQSMYEFRDKCAVLNDIKKSYKVEIL